ncbi:hypothetical protein PHLCEN_2v1714 [Hermanssonia centrifuga]|uniref:Noc2-domain-containing protein n=1 Tax=Hermanssonia centrifuga TaxID=98765 RepID=A0A2R6RW44_9APHY|nr:hypothetical protein PHLCEN_2v1714 [Hermanssonia centrifuga]
MGKKATKATRKFAASGQLKKTIQQRRKHQDIKRKTERRKVGKRGKGGQTNNDDEADDEGEEVGKTNGKFKGMSVDDFLGGGFMDGEDDEDVSAVQNSDDDDDEDDDEEMSDEDGSFASVDDLEDDDEGEAHLLELSKLAEKDPEFYKYLQENDKELLDFNPNRMEQDGSGDEEEEDGESVPILTKSTLQGWQKAILEHRSLRALRKLLIAFRSAAHMNEDNEVLAWSIDSPAVYNKLVTTSLKYTPVVLSHHCPHKTYANGKFKGPTQTPKWKTLQKLILSYFHNAVHILTQLTDNALLILALSETAKLVPYVTSSRKAMKVYLKTCLDLWSSAADDVRIAAFLSVRRLISSTDESLMDLALKNTYLTLVRACKSTSAHTLPSINLMKNSASELYTIDHAIAYQHAFGYIRQLAILLRNSLKVKSKEAYKQVYNWQYVHCVDFWAIVLARACDRQTEAERGSESELRPLIYPLVQVTMGATKLIPNSRSYPYHLHLSRSLLHITQRTNTYVPLAPVLLPMVTSPLISTSSSKSSTLRPLDFETTLRAPQQYLKTRVYAEGLVEEASFLLAEYLASAPVHASVGFPEIVVPILGTVRRATKAAQKGRGKGKEVGVVKALVERVEESAKWVEEKRRGVSFGPEKMSEVERWESGVKIEETPLGKYVRVLRKTREKRRKLVEKAREGEDEILEED